MQLFGYSPVLPRALVLTTVIMTIVCILAFISIPSLKDSTYPKTVLEKIEKLTRDAVDIYETPPAAVPQHLHFVIISCRVVKNGSIHIRSQWQHQMRQTRVMLKSLAYQSSSIIHINIVTNSKESYDDIVNITQSWPREYRDRFIFEEQRQVFYPKDLAYMLEMFAKCSTEKLFLHHILKDMDSVAFIDSDTIFMQAPEKYWQHFQSFGKNQVMGVTPCLYMYNEDRKSMPKFGETGINSGTILYNLTRVRNFPGGWENRIKYIAKHLRGHIQLGDQDIINMIFSANYTPLAYEVGCEWNYRPRVCAKDRNRCPNAASKGVAILHGCAVTFVNSQAPRFKAVFEAWEKFELGSSDKELVDILEGHLHNVSHVRRGCYRLSNIDDILLKGLKGELREKELAKQKCNPTV